MANKRAERVLVIGLDGAAPRFVFGPGAFDLPHLRRLMSRGCWGALDSCDPPITVPAWACMMSGKDPGVLGCYGFRNRADYSYSKMRMASAVDIQEPRVWDILRRAGKQAALVGVPQTYPVTPFDGWLISDAPDCRGEYTHPRSLKTEIEQRFGRYLPDVPNFRIDDRDQVKRGLVQLLHNRFDVAQYILTTKPWDFFMVVDMTVDRVHHGFWKYADPVHPKHVPGHFYAGVLREFYEMVDARVGALLENVADDTAVLVVSDHGARPMIGGVCLNEWLIQRGWLALRERPSEVTPFDRCAVDWPATRVWAAGGYYGRLFINVAGREPQGLVPMDDYEAFRDCVATALETMRGPYGEPLHNRVLKPDQIYRATRRVPPDLLAYLGDLSWRAIGSIGYDAVFTSENDTGPDDANHDRYGIFIMDDRSGRNGVELPVSHITDVAPTVLDMLGVPVPEDMQGKVI